MQWPPNRPVRFGLRFMKTRQFAILQEEVPADNTIDIKVGFEFGVNVEDKAIMASFDYAYYSNGMPLLKLVFDCFFGIHPEDWVQIATEDQIILPKQFAAHIMAITVSTSRGVLFTKTEGTNWASKPIKLQNVQEAFKEDVVIKTNTQVTQP